MLICFHVINGYKTNVNDNHFQQKLKKSERPHILASVLGFFVAKPRSQV